MRRLITFLAWSCALTLAGITAVANFRYGMLVAAGEERYVYAIGGTVLDVVKTFLPVAMGTFLAGPLTLGTFFRTVVGWLLWAGIVVWSMLCALGLYSIAKDAHVGDTVGQQNLYKQLTADLPKKEARVAELASAVPAEKLEGELTALKRDRLWTRTVECTAATATESRDFCAKVDKLRSAVMTARPAKDIAADLNRARAEVHEIETKLAGFNLADVFKKADPASDALAKFTGMDPELVKSRLAFLIALLFEMGGSLTVWIVCGSHAPRKAAPAPHSEPAAAAPPLPEPMVPVIEPAAVAAPVAPEITPIVLPEVDGPVAAWCKVGLVRRKGSFVPASDLRQEFETWCRLQGIDPLNTTAFGKEMTRLGFERKKIGGSQRYTDVGLVPKTRELRVVASNG